MKRILIADGNIPADRAVFTRFNGCAPSGMFDQLLRTGWSNIETEILYPTDADAAASLPLEAYDGILITGSNSNIYKREPGTLRQIEFAREAFRSGTPMFGVCWGLQLATVALGGDVEPSRSENCRCEAPFGEAITLVQDDTGCIHPMHKDRAKVFDAFAFHSDQVSRLPPNSTITASNRNFIQAAEIRSEKSVFWGVQYHPELSGAGMAGFLRGSINELYQAGRYHSLEEIEAAAAAMESFAHAVPIAEAHSRHFEKIDPARFEFRPLELINWVEKLVIGADNDR
ncbi:type 1 glutamine amidotransferase (plasmid) [Aminobacter sp. SR38]|uniref:type 1 glutamine amidotransferase n=2 Tax=Hyphomicrobiales TaxID=356 RepID=UPI001786CEA0|nr:MULTISPECIES: type 1 glutamine amidotransferase [Hyphomicrobiales]MCZ7497380.1 type 1 glutamine amidotransferase [Rhizobium rhizogenes]MCZ7501873.1 type 1 glutamine amidotransferase [Rhizobium rhizogenes]QOF75345.1 type 1 glutamine amidotransferase [Aminobacter sp. SR38]